MATKVLIVDDDRESRELLSEVLEANGYSVGAVGDGTAARAALAQDGDYSVVIADLRMPDGSGLELLRDLRRANYKQEIILMSSFLSGPERQMALALGARALLDKPFRLTELLQVVGNVAGRSSVPLSP